MRTAAALIGVTLVSCGRGERPASPRRLDRHEVKPGPAARSARAPSALHIVDFGVGYAVLSDGRIRVWGGDTATPRELGTVPGAVSLRLDHELRLRGQPDKGYLMTSDGRVLAVQLDGQTLQAQPATVPRARWIGTGLESDYVAGVDGKLTIMARSLSPGPDKLSGTLTGVLEAFDGDAALLDTGKLVTWEYGAVREVSEMPLARDAIEFMHTVCVVARAGGVTCTSPGWQDHQSAPRVIAGMEHATALAGDVAYGRDPLTGMLCAVIEHGQIACAPTGSAETDSFKADYDAIGKVERVRGITGATRIAVSRRSACAETTTGLWCWGENENGELGDGTRIDRTTPVQVAHLLDDVLPPPRTGDDAVPESSTSASWVGLPRACKRPTQIEIPRFNATPRSVAVASAYAWWKESELNVRLASYRTEPKPAVADPRGEQTYVWLTFDRTDRGGDALRIDRGHYVEDDGASRKLSAGYVTDSEWADLDVDAADLDYLDTHWACGHFVYSDSSQDPTRRLTIPFAAPILKASPVAGASP